MPHSEQKYSQKKFDKPPLFLNPIQRRVLAATTLVVCVLYLIGGEPRQAAALVRKYHTILWDKPTAARLYDFFASASGVPPHSPSTDRHKLHLLKLRLHTLQHPIRKKMVKKKSRPTKPRGEW